MRRTQLYLEEDLWNTLHNLARKQGTTVSQLVRQAIRGRYLGDIEERRRAMQAFVGLRAHRSEPADVDQYVRNLRQSKPIERLGRL